ncbi:MAG TPA: radical SAM protein [Candidatus Thermoplasmatota archaeon]|nr:radical SAM protein [Candidatus Thermoplasmatota archaeon]
MRIFIPDELSISTAFSPLKRSFLYTFAFVPTVITPRQIAAVTPPPHTVMIAEGNQAIDFATPYDVVHINFKTALAPTAYDIADRFRRKGSIVVLSGYHPSALPEEAKLHADAVIIGDAVTLWPSVVRDLENKGLQQFYKLEGSCGMLVLPSTKNIHPLGHQLVNAIEATRGCPQRCDFCQDSNIRDGAVFRARPVEDVIEEIASLRQKIFFFTDFSLTIDLSYTKALFRGMRGLGKKFICGGNVDVLAKDDELLRLSHDAGCIEWISGFETFTQEALEQAHKKTNLVDQYSAAVKKIHQNKMAVFGTFVVGFDEDTPGIFPAMQNHIRELGIDAVNFAILTPYPGTPLFQRLEHEGRILTHDWSKYNRETVVFTPKNMSRGELEAGFVHLMRYFGALSYLGYQTMRGLRLGFYPFISMFAGNLGQYMKAV